jgi:hypothetical protein
MSSYLNQGQPCLNPTCTNDMTNQSTQSYNQRNQSQYPTGAGLPTGIPTGSNVSPYAQQMPPTFQQGINSTDLTSQSASLMPITPTTQPPAVTLASLQYFNGYLRTQIGKKVKVQFLIGTNIIQDRTGTLLGVGANYILMRETETNSLLMCDFYTIKFVNVYD